MDEVIFKSTLIKAMETMRNEYDMVFEPELDKVMSILPNCSINLEETGTYAKRAWNVYQTILHIRVPIEKAGIFEFAKDYILKIANKIYEKREEF